MRRFLLLVSVLSIPPALADDPITLAEAQARVLAASPSLAARAAAIRAADGAVQQARALPNPVVLLEAEDFGGGLGYDEAQTTLSLEQTIETGGKRGARTAVAERAREAAALDLAAQRTQLLADTARRFATLLGAQERLGIRREILHITEELEATVRTLVAAGEVAPLEIGRVEAERIVAASEVRRSDADCELARGALASLWGDPEARFAGATGALAVPDPPPDLGEVARRVDASPALAAQRTAVARQEADADARRREARPDLALLGGVRRLSASDDTVFVAAVGIPLPLFDRRRGAIAEAEARRDEAASAAEAARVALQADARRARLEALIAVEDARVLQDELLPRARTTYEAVLEGYRRGKFRWLELLAARRDLVAVELRSVEARLAAQTAAADLAALMGLEPAARGEEEGR
jgi:cobalt-zinc-cadmium efflux system outer membrane protein